MPRPNRFQIMDLYRQEILNALKSTNKSVLTPKDLQNMLGENSKSWKLPKSTTVGEFTEFLVDRRKILRSIEFNLNGRDLIRYITTEGGVGASVLALSLFPDVYLSHFSAVAYHDFTNEIVKAVYVNREQAEKKSTATREGLLQHNIDQVFSRPMRQTSSSLVFDGQTIFVLNGRYTNHLGVIKSGDTRVTDLERTLIDITVRPEYSGGVGEVLYVFQQARGKVSANKLRMYLQKLNYAYPYHQAIGFYMERAGFNEVSLKLMETFPIQHNFYLTYNMSEKAFSERWQLFYPKYLSV